MAGATAAAPLLGGTARADTTDADALFQTGQFEEAGRAYDEILKKDPNNVQATRQRGYVALLSNNFTDAEEYLNTALKLAPDDTNTNRLLGDCYLRQDKFSLAAPRWQAIGDEGYAKWFAAVPSNAYEIHGDTARLPWQQTDPFPLVEASVNGGPAKRFMFYVGAPSLGVSSAVAKEVGLRAVAQEQLDTGEWLYYGMLDSLKLGDMELRNIPVSWSTTASGEDIDNGYDGLIGTWVFYHLLTTFDYAGRSLILRRPTPEAASKVSAAYARTSTKPLPLWLAFDHMVHSKGSIAGSSPRVMAVNPGGVSENVAGMPEETSKQFKVRTDYDRPLETAAHSHPTIAYPCYPKQIRLGDAVANEAYCVTNPNMQVARRYGFNVWADFAHSFFKPYNITLDFKEMNIHITKGKAT